MCVEIVDNQQLSPKVEVAGGGNYQAPKWQSAYSPLARDTVRNNNYYCHGINQMTGIKCSQKLTQKNTKILWKVHLCSKCALVQGKSNRKEGVDLWLY